MTPQEYYVRCALHEMGLIVVPEEVLVDRMKEMAQRHWDDHDREIEFDDEGDYL